MRSGNTYHVVVRLLGLVKGEDLVIDHRVDVVGFNSADHILHQGLATNIDTAHGADLAQDLEDHGLARGVATAKEANDADDTLELDALETFLERSGASDFDNVVNTLLVGREVTGNVAPVGLGLVVDDVVGAKLLQLLSLLGGRSRRDHSRAGRFGKLQR